MPRAGLLREFPWDRTVAPSPGRRSPMSRRAGARADSSGRILGAAGAVGDALHAPLHDLEIVALDRGQEVLGDAAKVRRGCRAQPAEAHLGQRRLRAAEVARAADPVDQAVVDEAVDEAG